MPLSSPERDPTFALAAAPGYTLTPPWSWKVSCHNYIAFSTRSSRSTLISLPFATLPLATYFAVPLPLLCTHYYTLSYLPHRFCLSVYTRPPAAMAGEGASEDASDRLFTVHMLPSNPNGAIIRTKGSSFPVPDHVTAKGIEKLACAYSEVVYGETDSTLEFYCKLVRRGQDGRQIREADPPTPLSQLVRSMGATPQQHAPVPQQQGTTPEQQEVCSTPQLFAATPQQLELNATPPSAQPHQDQTQRVPQLQTAGGSLHSRPVNRQQTFQFARPQTSRSFTQSPLQMMQQSHETPQLSQQSSVISHHTQSSQPTIQVEHTQSQDNSNTRKRARTAPEDDGFDHISDYESDEDAPPRPVKKRKLPAAITVSSSPAPSSAVKRTNSNNAWTPEEDENLLRGLRAGLTVSEIAAKYGIDRSTSAMRNRKRELLKNDDTIPETQVSAWRQRSQASTRPTPHHARPARATPSTASGSQPSLRQTFFKRDKGKGRAGDAPSSSLRLVSEDRDANSAVDVNHQSSHPSSIAEAPSIDLTEDTQQVRSSSSSHSGQSGSGDQQSSDTGETSHSQRNGLPPPAKAKAADLQENARTHEASEQASRPAPITTHQSSSRTGRQPDDNVAKSKHSFEAFKRGPASGVQRQEEAQASERTEAVSSRTAKIAANQRAGGSSSKDAETISSPNKFEELTGVKQSTSPEEWPDFSISGPKRNMLTVGVPPHTSEVHVEIFERHTDEFMIKDAIRVAKKEERLQDAQEIFDFAKLHMRMWYAVAARDWEENTRLQERCRRMYRETRVRNGLPPGPRVTKTEEVEVEGEDGVITIEERTWSQTASNIGDYEDMMAELKELRDGDEDDSDDSDIESESDVEDDHPRERLVDGPGRILGEEIENHDDSSEPADYDFASEQLLREAEQFEVDQEADASANAETLENDSAELPTFPPGQSGDEPDEGINDAEVLQLVASDARVDAFDVFDEDDNFVGRTLGQPTGAESPMVCRTSIAGDLEAGRDDARLKEIRKARRKQRKREKNRGRSESVQPSEAASDAPSVGSFVESAQSHRGRRHRRSSGEARSGALAASSDGLQSTGSDKQKSTRQVEMPPPPLPAAGTRPGGRGKTSRHHDGISSETQRRKPAVEVPNSASPTTHAESAVENLSEPAEKPTSPDASKAAADAKNMPPPRLPVKPQPRRKLVSLLGTFNLGLWSPDRPREPRIVEQPKPVQLPFVSIASDLTFAERGLMANADVGQ